MQVPNLEEENLMNDTTIKVAWKLKRKVKMQCQNRSSCEQKPPTPAGMVLTASFLGEVWGLDAILSVSILCLEYET